jgi:hypothetical protein
MAFGMTPFTLFHVLLSLVGIVSGLVVLVGLISSRRLDVWAFIFLFTTAATSVTGFLFPIHGPTPGLILGVVSLAVLAAAIYGRYGSYFRGAWRWIYVIGCVAALYFNVFVFIVQAFVKLAPLHALAPTIPPSGPVFLVAQCAALIAFLILGFVAVRRFHPVASLSAPRP